MAIHPTAGSLMSAFSLHGRVDVVICLSTTVRNDTLQEAKEHRVSLKCRKQLRVEELEMVMALETTALVLSQLRRTGEGDRFCCRCEAEDME